MKGLIVFSKIEFTNAYGTMPAGTKFTITDKMNGLGLVSDACSHCGVQMRIRKVAPEHVGLTLQA